MPNAGSVFKLSCLLLLAAIVPAAADDCDAAVSQSEINACMQGSFEAADADLNAAYQAVRATLGDDAEGLRLLTVSERAWLAWRDAECDFVAYPNRGGSIEPAARFGCLAEVTAARARQLDELAGDDTSD